MIGNLPWGCLWIVTSARVCRTAVNFTLQFFVAFVMKFVRYFVHFQIFCYLSLRDNNIDILVANPWHGFIFHLFFLSSLGICWSAYSWFSGNKPWLPSGPSISSFTCAGTFFRIMGKHVIGHLLRRIVPFWGPSGSGVGIMHASYIYLLGCRTNLSWMDGNSLNLHPCMPLWQGIFQLDIFLNVILSVFRCMFDSRSSSSSSNSFSCYLSIQHFFYRYFCIENLV